MKSKMAIAVAGLACALTVLLPVTKLSNSKSEEYEVVFFGDSIIASNHSGLWDIPTIVGDGIEMRVLNAAIGGTTLCDIAYAKKVGDCNSIYSMSAIAKSIYNADFSIQILASQKENTYVDEWRGIVSEQLKKIDFAKTKYILIEHGANDYLSGITIENDNDLHSEETFAGQLRTIIEELRYAAPDSKIVLITPIYIFPYGYDKDCHEMDFGGGILDKYVEKEIEIAGEYGIILIDNFHDVDINKENFEEYIPGGLHGNYEGNRLIAENIVKHLKELDERD